MLSVWPRAIGAQRRGTRAELDQPTDRVEVGSLRRRHGRKVYRARNVALRVYGLHRDV